MDWERPRRAEELELQDAGDELLVHDPRAKQIHVLNSSAGTILRLCDGTRGLEEIVEIVASGADVDSGVVLGDTRRILNEFAALGLLHEGQVRSDRDTGGETR